MSEYIPAVCGIESKLWLRFSSTLSILMTSSFQNWHRNHRFKTYTARITCACGLHQKNRCENGLPKKMSTTKLKINSKGASLNDKIHSSSYDSAFMGYERMNLFMESNNSTPVAYLIWFWDNDFQTWNVKQTSFTF